MQKWIIQCFCIKRANDFNEKKENPMWQCLKISKSYFTFKFKENMHCSDEQTDGKAVTSTQPKKKKTL